jgi:hypothetical protein
MYNFTKAEFYRVKRKNNTIYNGKAWKEGAGAQLRLHDSPPVTGAKPQNSKTQSHDVSLLSRSNRTPSPSSSTMLSTRVRSRGSCRCWTSPHHAINSQRCLLNFVQNYRRRHQVSPGQCGGRGGERPASPPLSSASAWYGACSDNLICAIWNSSSGVCSVMVLRLAFHGAVTKPRASLWPAGTWLCC